VPKVALQDDPLLIVTKSFLGGSKSVARRLIRLANASEENAVYWVSRLATEGVSKALFDEVERKLRPIEIPTHIAGDWPHKKYYYKRAISLTNPTWIPNLDAAFAFALSMVITDGLGERFRRCQLRDCGKYFLGDRRARWCKKGHGSLHRVRKMRKKQ